MNTTVNLFVDGEEVSSSDETLIELFDPLTGQRSITFPAGCDADVEQAVSSARAAFDDGRWCDLEPSERSEILHKFAGLIEDHSTDLDRLDALDMGKPQSIGFGNAASGASVVRHCAVAANDLTGDIYRSGKSSTVYQQFVPRGVIAAITPWNFPASQALTKLAPALATGNCVVLKPSECSPRSAMCLAQLAIEAGMPPGVFNLVPGKGETVGKALALSNDVDMIAFTGSTSIGKLMLQYAGQSNMKLVHAECGGKSPQIVFTDYGNLDEVADSVAQSILTNQGQVCVAGSRLLVQKEIEAELIEKLVERFKNIVPGDPLDTNTTYGPLVNQTQLNRVLDYIEEGKKTANLVCGGKRILEETGGYFVEPTLFSQVPPDSKIAREEIFGPVLAVTSFTDVDNAIRLANATQYGLAATVWTTNLAVGLRASKEIRSGVVSVNASVPRGECSKSLSVEPYGLSGVGVEHGSAGLLAYMRRQVTWLNHGGQPYDCQ